MGYYTLNVYTVVLALGFVQGGAVAAVLARRGRRPGRRADAWLAALLAAVAVSTVPYLIGFAGLYTRHYGLTFFPLDNPALLGPLALLHVRAVVAPHGRSGRGGLSLIPAGLYTAVSLAVWTLPAADKQSLSDVYGLPIALGEVGLSAAVNGVCLGLAGRAAWALRRAGSDPVGGVWATRLTAGLGAVVGIDAALGAAAPLAFETRWWAEAATAAAVYAAAVGGLAFSSRWRPAPPPRVEDVAAERARLDAWMRRARPYLDPGVTAAALAAQAGLPTSRLAAVVQEGFGVTFAEFVNRYRVEEVQARLRTPAAGAFTLVAIAQECGFASKATFNRVFKDLTGLTPSAWRDAHARPEESQPVH